MQPDDQFCGDCGSRVGTTRSKPSRLLIVLAILLVLGTGSVILVRWLTSPESITGAEIEQFLLNEVGPAEGSDIRADTFECESGSYIAGDEVTCSVQRANGETVRLAVDLSRTGSEWKFLVDAPK